jgi:arylsulfatase A-like enzyme
MPPNVVCILVDDMGWRDLGCYGSPFYETPRIDELAREGTRFTDAYASCPVCSPTRASVQTGQYPARVGVTDWIDFGGGGHPLEGALVDAPYTDHLPADVRTLPQALPDDYATWHVGKWHLGGEEQDALPTDRGYDENVAGCEWGMPGNGYFSPYDMPNIENGPAGEYLTDRLTDEAIDLLADHGGDEPFFLNLCYYAVHTPIQAKSDAVERYEAKRESLGLHHEQEFEVGEAFPTEHKRDRRVRRRLVQSDPTYAAMVEHLDANVGRLLDALAERGLAENTVVLLTADNGGLATAEGSPTCNRPLRDGKGWMYEGGNRVPFIVRWPGVTDGPEVCREPVTSPDVYPTVLAAADTDPPDQPVDGEDLRPVLEGGESDRNALFWHYPHYGNQGCTPAAAVREGDWKLVEFYENDHVELYHLGNDVEEDRNLAPYHPERVDRLRGRLVEWRASVDAEMPAENPDFEPWRGRRPPGA